MSSNEDSNESFVISESDESTILSDDSNDFQEAVKLKNKKPKIEKLKSKSGPDVIKSKTTIAKKNDNKISNTDKSQLNNKCSIPISNNIPIVTNNSDALINDITKGPPVSTEASAKKIILQYMIHQNRPYSVIQVHDNLHGRIPKQTVQRVLDILSNGTDGQLKMKEYGKAKIYYLNQVRKYYY